MEMYGISEDGNAETYTVLSDSKILEGISAGSFTTIITFQDAEIQGSQSASLSTASLIEHIETMYNEGAPEFVVDHGMYYPTTASYGYYCTGFESPGNWGDQHRVFTVDGPEIQCQGAEIENLPYVYYTPSYGYAQSLYNPYNPYIPGAMVGLDGSFVGPQQYISDPQYQDCVPYPYYPLASGQSRPEALLNTPSEPLVHKNSTLGNRLDSCLPKNNLSSSSAPFTMIASESTLNHPKHFAKVTDGAKANSRSPQPSAYGRSNHDLTPTVDNVLNSRGSLYNNQLKGAVAARRDPTDTGPVADEQSAAGQSVPESNQDRGYGVKVNPMLLNDQNSKDFNIRDKLIVKAYTSRIENADAEGNITIHADQYNKEDLPVDYVNAKFFVIKSYSEDDVHKSIKYNVWSSTPNGNKKLGNAYEDAQSLSGGIQGGCPIFLFFSVNASGQFCGVAEMVGRVDIHQDMDFWQQDKWSGSFAVKWHIIKDVPNSNFRHITLANNENKPVTNSRDTQEIPFTPGREMLKIFKNHKLKTSVLDDFMYYESRQKVIHEGRTRLLTKTKGTLLFVPALEPPRKLNCVVECPSAENEKPTSTKHTVLVVPQSVSEKDIMTVPPSTTGDGINMIRKQNESEVKGELMSTLMIGSLTIESKGAELKARNGPPAIVHPKPVETVTIDSLPVKVNGLTGCGGPLTFGSLPADIKGLKKKSRK